MTALPDKPCALNLLDPIRHCYVCGQKILTPTHHDRGCRFYPLTTALTEDKRLT